MRHRAASIKNRSPASKPCIQFSSCIQSIFVSTPTFICLHSLHGHVSINTCGRKQTPWDVFLWQRSWSHFNLFTETINVLRVLCPQCTSCTVTKLLHKYTVRCPPAQDYTIQTLTTEPKLICANFSWYDWFIWLWTLYVHCVRAVVSIEVTGAVRTPPPPLTFTKMSSAVTLTDPVSLTEWPVA